MGSSGEVFELPGNSESSVRSAIGRWHYSARALKVPGACETDARCFDKQLEIELQRSHREVQEREATACEVQSLSCLQSLQRMLCCYAFVAACFLLRYCDDRPKCHPRLS